MSVTDPELTSINGIDKAITFHQDALSSLPRSCHDERSDLHLELAALRHHRFFLSHDEQDLEMSILQSTHAILLPFGGQLLAGKDLRVIMAFYLLASTLIFYSHKRKQPCGISYGIKCLHFLRGLSHRVPATTHTSVTTSLFYALAFRVQLEEEPGNVIQSPLEPLDEMLGLCHELCSLEISEQDLKEAIDCFASTVISRIDYQTTQPSQQVIDFLREANRRRPDLHHVPFALLASYYVRFLTQASIDDYENAMPVFDNIFANPPANGPSPDWEEALRKSAGMARRGFHVYGNPEFLEEAIFRYRALLKSISLENPIRGETVQSLAELEKKRFDEFGITNGLPEANSGGPQIDVDPLLQLASSIAESKSPMTVRDYTRHFQAVLELNQITDKSDIEGAAKYCRLVLKSIQERESTDNDSKLMLIRQSGDFFYRAHVQTNDPAYLNEAIDAFQAMFKSPRTEWHSLHFLALPQLISFLVRRVRFFDDRKDLEEIMRLSPIAATDPRSKVFTRIEMSCTWARVAKRFRHPSASTAYKNAISLMQDFLTSAPTLDLQHFRLVSMRSNIWELPLEYASYHAHNGQLMEAIETLEQGRGLLWSELRGMRTSIDQLCTANLPLGEKFAAINRDLEALTTSAPGAPTFWSNGSDIDSGEEMDPFGRTVVKQRKLLAERSSLITQIRSLPGFDNFLITPSFETLRSAAAHGPVVIINHCYSGSAIIILLHDRPPSLIPTKVGFYDRVKGLKEQLSAARKRGLESKTYDDALSSVLESLHNLIGQPVIQKLQELKIPEQSRIWWCPTSDLCSLPLHAMGPVRLEGGFKLYFSDLYIPSYTPSLSALVESHKPSPHSFEKPSILLVAQPDEYMPNAWREISVIRSLDTTVTTLFSKRATPSTVTKHLQDHRFAHFTCHGGLEAGKPFDAFFQLYQGRRLTLLEVVRSQLPSAEFAFLSACHTAELTEESIADEGLHLSAAVQYSGFRSVVGTMWEMADIDGHVVTKYFYASLFSEGLKDVPYYARTAEALRDAVKELRKKVTLERWVNFVHYGA